MSVGEKKDDVITLNEITNELSDTHDIFLKLHSAQIAVSYMALKLAEDIEDKIPLDSEVLFGIRSILEMSADLAHERAIHTNNFEMFKLKAKALAADVHCGNGIL